MENKITLAFDTCLDKMYVVLKKNDNILSSKVIENTQTHYHSAYLISTIADTLNENGISPQEITLIAINIGPGSFTGIRACTTVARVFAQASGCKTVGVSSLEILSKITDVSNPLVALDARKNKAYLFYDNEIKGAVELEKVKELAESGEFTVITDDRLQPLLGGTSYQQGEYALGEILTNLAEEKIKNEDGDWHNLHPLYIQPPPMG